MAHKEDVNLGIAMEDLPRFVRGLIIQAPVPVGWGLKVGDTIDWSCGDAMVGTAEVTSPGRQPEDGMLYCSFKWVS